MVEQAIYFALGCIITALGALMFAPVFWSRALRLTRQRMQLQVPVSMQEIYAERDGLRAEFAVERLRLEQAMERVRAGKSEDMAEIGRRSMEIARLNDELAAARRDAEEKAETVASLQRSVNEGATQPVGATPGAEASRLRALEVELAASRNALAEAREREKALHIGNGMKAEKGRGASQRFEALQAENAALREKLAQVARPDPAAAKVDGELRESIHALGVAVAAMTREAREGAGRAEAKQNVDAH